MHFYRSSTKGTLLHHWECHSRYLTTCAFYRHKRDLLLATGGNDKKVKIWKVKFAGEEEEQQEDVKEEVPSSLEVDSQASSISNSSSSFAAVPELLSPKARSKTTKIADWSVDQVCEWLTKMLELRVSLILSRQMSSSTLCRWCSLFSSNFNFL